MAAAATIPGGNGTRRPPAPARAPLAEVAAGGNSRDGDGDIANIDVSDIQRSRLLMAAIGVVDELGYGDATVTHITTRARISRRTFYELFDNREECLLAMLEYALELIAAELSAAEIEQLPWRERLRTGLWTILSFFDREPTLARVCVVQTLRGDQPILERRTEALALLAHAIDEGRRESARAANAAPLSAEGIVGAAHSIVYARLLMREPAPLSELLNDLMAIVLLPYLGPEAARREHARSMPVETRSDEHRLEKVAAPPPERNPLEGIPMRLTYRTARVLHQIAARPGISNREVAEQAGISDQGQMSKLLSRLQRFGLVVNDGEGHSKGEPNAWTLTPNGACVAQSILIPTHNRRGAR